MSATAVEYSTGWLAERIGGELRGPASLSIRGVNSLEYAEPDEITLISSLAYGRRWSESKAGAAVISRGIEADGHDPRQRALIIVPDALQSALTLLDLYTLPEVLPDPGVHPTAWVHPEATIGADVRIGPHASVDAGTVIGDRCVLHAGVRVYHDVRIGSDCLLHANAIVRERCRIGSEVILHAGACIGSDGFGYIPDPEVGGWRKLPHIGTVEIGDRVEIGANACIDRGKFGATAVGDGTKIDNMVQIGHNCRIGRNSSISALCGFAGSSEVGDGVLMGGLIGIRDHIRIGDGAQVGAMAGVMRDVKPGQRVMGFPAEEAGVALRREAAIRKLPALIKKLESRQEAPGSPG